MSICSWLKLTAALWLLGKAVKAFGWLLAAAVAVTAWPLTAVAGIGYLAAWLRGWPPARLWRAAAWSLPMTAVYGIGQALRLHAWPAVALAPVDDYGHAWRLLAAGAILRAGELPGPARRGLAGDRLRRRPARCRAVPDPGRQTAHRRHSAPVRHLAGPAGPALDGPGTLEDADAWYCILEGTREASVAEAQAMALTELVAHAATDPGTERRAILLAADD